MARTAPAGQLPGQMPIDGLSTTELAAALVAQWDAWQAAGGDPRTNWAVSWGASAAAVLREVARG